MSASDRVTPETQCVMAQEMLFVGVRSSTGEKYPRLVPLSRFVSLWVGSAAQGKPIKPTPEERNDADHTPVICGVIGEGEDCLEVVEVLDSYCADILDSIGRTAAYQLLSEAAHIAGAGVTPNKMQVRWKAARQAAQNQFFDE